MGEVNCVSKIIIWFHFIHDGRTPRCEVTSLSRIRSEIFTAVKLIPLSQTIKRSANTEAGADQKRNPVKIKTPESPKWCGAIRITNYNGRRLAMEITPTGCAAFFSL